MKKAIILLLVCAGCNVPSAVQMDQRDIDEIECFWNVRHNSCFCLYSNGHTENATWAPDKVCGK